jgi:hypothetical protein
MIQLWSADHPSPVVGGSPDPPARPSDGRVRGKSLERIDKRLVMDTKFNTDEKPDCVVIDTNIWRSDRLLKTGGEFRGHYT